MADSSLTIEETLTLLRQTPRRITAITAGLSQKHLHERPAEDEWSANEVLAHLRSCADVWGEAIAKVLAQETPKFRLVSPRSWPKRIDYLVQDFKSSLNAFTRQRKALLTVLEPLPPEGWYLKAIVTGSRSPGERTVLSFATHLAAHEHTHLEQFQRIADTLPAKR